MRKGTYPSGRREVSMDEENPAGLDAAITANGGVAAGKERVSTSIVSGFVLLQ